MMSDCKEHGYYPYDDSRPCPYCRITELETRLEAVGELPEGWRYKYYNMHKNIGVDFCADELDKALEVSK
jgi:hypothetical protein